MVLLSGVLLTTIAGFVAVAWRVSRLERKLTRR